MELFDKNGCLTDEGLQALQAGGLDELGRLETAEHLSYCDKCMDRYTALLTADALETQPHSAHKAVMAAIWVRLMQNTWGRAAVAGVAAVLVAMLAVVSLFIIANTIKLSTFTRREEIAIMKMCGATNWFVRAPFLVEGVILGLAGGIIAFFCQWGIYGLITRA